MGVPAQAGPPAPASHTAPYDFARGLTYVTCLEGATCTVEATADAGGVTKAAATYSREKAATGAEAVSGHGEITHSVRLPHKADAATISMVWLVDSARTDASAQAGRLFGGTYLWANARCGAGKCATASTSKTITFCGGQAPLSTPCNPANATAPSQQVTLTMKLTDLRGQFADVTTAAAAFVGAQRGCLRFEDGKCAVEAPDETHAGEATSSISATLQSISVTAG